jgi:hypothetical protein
MEHSMKKLLVIVALGTALAAPAFAPARTLARRTNGRTTTPTRTSNWAVRGRTCIVRAGGSILRRPRRAASSCAVERRNPCENGLVSLQ